MFELENKVAIITGGASGIGLCYAKELLRKGLKGVALVDTNQENGIKAIKEINAEFEKDNCAIFIKADVTDDKQLENAFETVVKTYNQFDILFNNAGIVNEVQWKRCIDINIAAVVNGSNLAIDKYFPKYRSGSESLIVNTASVAFIQPPENLPVYTATKYSVVGFTRAMGGNTRYKISKTRVVAICPGLVYTPILNITEKEVPEPYLSSQINIIEQVHDGQRPEEVAKNVVNIIPNAPTGSVWKVTIEGCNKMEFAV